MGFAPTGRADARGRRGGTTACGRYGRAGAGRPRGRRGPPSRARPLPAGGRDHPVCAPPRRAHRRTHRRPGRPRPRHHRCRYRARRTLRWTGLWCAGGRHARCYPPRRAAGGHADQPGLRREIVAGHDRHGAISQRSRRDRSCSTAMGACPRSAPTATTRSARVSGPGRSRLQPRRLGSRPPCPLCRAAPAGGRSSATRHARGTRRACRRSRSRWRP
jgi:hypothetical protein